jgi:uncharacterized protein (DUF1330 family)
MPAYVVIDIEVHDAATYERYKQLAPPAIAAYGGRYLARGGETAVLEGNWQPKRLVILQFDSVARAKEWIDSPEYAEARALRQSCSTGNMVVVEGLA